MPSPFPGMDPYLEGQYWPDFHDRLINSLSEVIADQLPPGYDTQIRERVYLVEPEIKRHRIEPGVAIDHREGFVPGISRTAMPAVGEGTLVKPVTLPLLLLDPIPETYIEVETYPDHQVVAVIEILSPSNETGRGRVEYLDKRDELIRSPAHLMEIDLLLGGTRLPFGAPLPKGSYFGFVSASDRRPACDVYAWNLRDAFPIVPIPLKSGDPDVAVSLKSAFDIAYSRGRYHRKLDYTQPPAATIPEQDRQWVRDIALTAPQPRA
jgi:hypothetical protein